MKVFLMHRDRDLDLLRELPRNAEDLVRDLELDTLYDAMAGGDDFLLDIATKVVLAGLTDPEDILYRQSVLADCLAHPDVVREIYAIATETIAGERRSFIYLSKWSTPNSILARSVDVLQLFVTQLKRLRSIADERAADFGSEGFRRFFTMIEAELDDRYFAEIEDHLRELRFQNGVLISAELGQGNKGTNIVLRRPFGKGRRRRLSWARSRSITSFRVDPRDEAGITALAELRGQGVNLVANALGQSTDHILAFFTMVRSEVAFYVASLNLHERLIDGGEPTSFPIPQQAGRPELSFEGLYDPCLALHLESRVVGNDLRANGIKLVVITGANQGGKSTFLRSVGLAYLMMQCGMFVSAVRFRASLRAGIFTHHKREEDASMESGKLAEELGRMRAIVDLITPESLLLCNESFASTNEREGSEIARQVIGALVEVGVEVVFVTHLFDLAQGFFIDGYDATIFLRAERASDGTRSFRLVEGEPLATSFGGDIYQRLFDERGQKIADAPVRS
jgi:MutS domain V